MKLTEKEEKLARLALDKAAQPGERQAAAAKLIESFYVRGVRVEDIEKESVHIEYREPVQTQTVCRGRPVPRRSGPTRAPQATPPTKCYYEPLTKVKPERSHVWTCILGVAAAFATLLTLLTSALSNSAPMTAEKRKQQEAGWGQFKEADRKERELLQKQEAQRKARYEAKREKDCIIGATPAPQ